MLCLICLQVKTGVVYEGIFNAIHVEGSELSVVLKYAKPVRGLDAKAEKDALAEKPALVMTIKSEDLVQIFAKDIKLNAEALGPEIDNFETDASISRGRG